MCKLKVCTGMSLRLTEMLLLQNRVLTVDFVVWRQQSDVGQGDSARVAVVKLHCDKIVILVDI